MPAKPSSFKKTKQNCRVSEGNGPGHMTWLHNPSGEWAALSPCVLCSFALLRQAGPPPPWISVRHNRLELSGTLILGAPRRMPTVSEGWPTSALCVPGEMLSFSYCGTFLPPSLPPFSSLPSLQLFLTLGSCFWSAPSLGPSPPVTILNICITILLLKIIQYKRYAIPFILLYKQFWSKQALKM